MTDVPAPRDRDEYVEERMEQLRKRIEERVREIDAPGPGFQEKIRRLLKKMS